MSFTEEVKHELIRNNNHNKEEMIAELSALIRINGSIQIINKQLAVNIKLYYGDLARKIYSYIKDEFGFTMEIVVKQNNNFSRHHIYVLRIIPQQGIKKFLIKLGLLSEDENIIFTLKESFINNKNLQKSYLRGTFLGGGSINPPESEYHLEFRTEYESHAEDILELLAQFELKGHLIEHKNKYVIYFKSFADITKILSIIGAHQSLLNMENQHIVKNVKNNVNRRVNCETANLEKTVKAAMEQMEDINIIEKYRGFDNISKGLKEIAKLRRKNPYASLKELGQLLDPPLSKSGVNHRLRRLRKLADELRRGK